MTLLRARQMQLLAYDMADPRRLRRVAQQMEQAGARLQKSVFEVADRRERLAALATRLAGLIDPASDQVLLHACCAHCRRQTRWQGRPPSADVEPFWII